MALLFLTWGLAQINLGPFNIVVMLSISIIKTVLVILFFMHVKYSPRLVWVFVAAGFIWLAIMIDLTLSDYLTRPSEDFARATVHFVDEANRPLIVEATTSWSFVGAGLRLSLELLGPEYSLSLNSLDSGPKLFFSRNVVGSAGEDIVEKQNAEQGLMPVVANEESEYGYEGENRYFAQCFLEGRQPEENFYDGLEVTRLLMTAYMSAEQERALEYPPPDLDRFIPAVARGTWKP